MAKLFFLGFLSLALCITPLFGWPEVTVMTIDSPDGDVINCINKTSQQSLDYPLLKNHSLQERPSNMPDLVVGEEQWGWQIWHKSGIKCPEGSIPIRSLPDYDEDVLTKSSAADSPNQGHEYAMVDMMRKDSTIYGTQATMNVWRPKIEGSLEFSLGQILVKSGSYETNDLNTIEAGWQVYPVYYLDDQPRFFIYWTAYPDSYQAGCYNMRCSGFVQTSNTVLLEGAIAHTSTFGGTQADLTIKIWKDSKLESWWLGIMIGNGVITPVGYWPAILFNRMADHATNVQWGGEITNRNTLRHTRTQMGSGYFPDGGYRRAAYMSNLQIAEKENDFQRVHDFGVIVTNPDYYHLNTSKMEALGTHFFYGGSLQVHPTLQPHSKAVGLSLDSTFLFLCLSIFWFV